MGSPLFPLQSKPDGKCIPGSIEQRVSRVKKQNVSLKKERVCVYNF